MNTFLIDPIVPDLADSLRTIGVNVLESVKKPSKAFDEQMAQAQIVVVGPTRLTRRDIEAAPELSLIICASHEPHQVDVAAASERGVYVSVCTDHDAHAKAEFLWHLILSLDRSGKDTSDSSALGLRGQSLGLLGFGRVGELLAAYGAAFGMRVRAFANNLSATRATEANVRACSSADELMRTSDIVCAVTEALPEGTTVTEPLLKSLKPNSTFVSNLRADVLDVATLVKLSKSTHLKVGLAANRYDDEKLNALAKIKSARIHYDDDTRTREARTSAAATIVDTMHLYKTEYYVQHCVNLRTGAIPKTLIVRHKNVVGALAELLQILADENINIISVRNETLASEAAACTHLALSSEPTPAAMQQFRRKDAVLEAIIA